VHPSLTVLCAVSSAVSPSCIFDWLDTTDDVHRINNILQCLTLLSLNLLATTAAAFALAVDHRCHIAFHRNKKAPISRCFMLCVGFYRIFFITLTSYRVWYQNHIVPTLGVEETMLKSNIQQLFM
jgi:hypothetical protein